MTNLKLEGYWAVQPGSCSQVLYIFPETKSTSLMQVNKMDNLAGLAVKYHVTVGLNTSRSRLKASSRLGASLWPAGVGHQACKRSAVRLGDVRQGHLADTHTINTLRARLHH